MSFTMIPLRHPAEGKRKLRAREDTRSIKQFFEFMWIGTRGTPPGLAILLLGGLIFRFAFVCDDAFISFRFARYLAEGEGLRFNLLREAPVEGYSNFLWVLLMAGCEKLLLDVPLASQFLSGASAFGLLALVARFSEKTLGLGKWQVLATTLVLATLPAFAMWSTSGLETVPFALTIFTTYYALESGQKRGVAIALLCAAATVLLRADGIVWIGALLMSLFVAPPAGSSKRKILQVGLAAIAVFALHLAWRWSYYGDWMPQTFRAKGTMSMATLRRGSYYLATALAYMPAIAIIVVFACFAVAKHCTRVQVSALSFVTLSMLLSVASGGDHMPFARFLVPALPCIALLFGIVLQGYSRAPWKAGMFSATVIPLSLLACFDINVVPTAVREKISCRFGRPFQSEVVRWREMKRNCEDWGMNWGRALARHARPEDSVVLGGMTAAYYCDLFVWDQYGMVTPEVLVPENFHPDSAPGHDYRVNAEFFLPQRPNIMACFLTPIMLPEPGEPWPSWATPLRPGWRKDYPLGPLIHEESFLLPNDGEFPNDAIARIVRFHSWELPQSPRQH